MINILNTGKNKNWYGVVANWIQLPYAIALHAVKYMHRYNKEIHHFDTSDQRV